MGLVKETLKERDWRMDSRKEIKKETEREKDLAINWVMH